jgi:hypothetical protein
MNHFCLLETHHFTLDASFQPGAPGSACAKPQKAPAAAGFRPLMRSIFGNPGVQLIQLDQKKAGTVFGNGP